MAQSPATVTCTECEYRWCSESMAEGLRLLGSCPRCGGELEFHSDVPVESPGGAEALTGKPHRVMGIPRVSGW